MVAGTLILALLSVAPGCGRAPAQERVSTVYSASDAALRERDTALLGETDRLTARCARSWRTDPDCLREACRLRVRELGLFAEARAHNFTDITESNYWHRSRLKFPGDLEQLLRRLAEDSPSIAPPCDPDGTPGRPPATR